MTEDRRTVRPDVGLVSYPRTRVTVSRGPDSGRSRELTSLPLRVGSSSQSELVLTDPDVAERHCALEAVTGGIRIRDEGSGAPVFVGSARVFDAIVEPPFELSLGQSSLSLEALATSESREQSVAERFGDLRGRSARMRELFAELERVSVGEGNVLIEGERGSGRELVAESIHDASRRATGPFVVVRCNELSETPAGDEQAAARPATLEQELAFERAAQGTIYLHEIAALSLELQNALVRLLVGRAPTGGARTDARLLVSSSKNLSAEAERGGFLPELLQALSASHVRIPPLRDRMEDLPLLAEHFLSRAHPSCDSSAIARPLWHALAAYSWPGNVRELWSALDALALSERSHGAAQGSGEERVVSGSSPGIELVPLRIARRAAAEEFERSYLSALLARTEGNVTRAAAIAEVSRQMVQKLQRKHRVG
jgi:two-component system nitrogen regulation response regulator GlnG